jgi:hypothetical protein
MSKPPIIDHRRASPAILLVTRNPPGGDASLAWLIVTFLIRSYACGNEIRAPRSKNEQEREWARSRAKWKTREGRGTRTRAKKNGGRVLPSLVLVSGILANLGCVLTLGITFGPKWLLDFGEHEAG